MNLQTQEVSPETGQEKKFYRIVNFKFSFVPLAYKKKKEFCM